MIWSASFLFRLYRWLRQPFDWLPGPPTFRQNPLVVRLLVRTEGRTNNRATCALEVVDYTARIIAINQREES